MSKFREWFLTLVGIGFVLLGVYLHRELKGTGELPTILVIVLGGILIDWQLVFRAFREYKGGGPPPAAPVLLMAGLLGLAGPMAAQTLDDLTCSSTRVARVVTPGTFEVFGADSVRLIREDAAVTRLLCRPKPGKALPALTGSSTRISRVATPGTVQVFPDSLRFARVDQDETRGLFRLTLVAPVPPPPVPPPAPPPVPPPAPVPPPPAPVPPPAPTPTSGTKILAFDFEGFSTSSELIAAYLGSGPNGRLLGDYFGGLSANLGPQWRELTFSLQTDPLLGKTAQMRQVGIDSVPAGACPPYCVANTGQSGPTGFITFNLGKTVNPYWSSRTFRFLPGWTPAGNPGQALQYKLTADTYSTGLRLHRIVIGSGLFAPDFHLNGTARVLWQNKLSSFGSALASLKFPVVAGSTESKVFEVWTYYRFITADSVHAGAWVQWDRTGPRYGWLAAFTGGGPYPAGVTAYRNGENMNAGVVHSVFLRWGPGSVYEGGDPWGLLAAAGVKP